MKNWFIKALLLLFAVASTSAQSVSASRQNAITKAVQMCSPAIVGINVTEVKSGYTYQYSGNPFLDLFGPQRYYQQYEVAELGSGFIISSDGYILTNHHVAGNAAKAVVTLSGGEKYDAEIIGSDMMSDVCLLKISGKKFPYLKFGNSDACIVGEWAIAMGNPFGLFDNNAKPVITVGVVSNIGISFLQKQGNDYRIYKDMLQTDAAISSGNSGGPLINADGEVIGMNTIIFSTATTSQGAGSIGIGFSVPINRIKRFVDILMKDGEVKRNINLGLTITGIDDKTARYYNLKSRDGLLVFRIDNRSAASNAGIEVGDVIISVNGRKMLNTDDFLIAIGDAVVGDKVNIVVQRGTNTENITLVVPPSSKGR